MLDADTILTTTEDVLRRHGPAKATVVDVARALGVSHAAVYRYFPSKAALREAVTRRWLGRSHDALTRVADDTTLPPADRLRAWLHALFTAKRATATDDPELFTTYGILAAEHSTVAAEHVDGLITQLAGILAALGHPAEAARTVFTATAAFHHPAHAREWTRPDAEQNLDALCDLLLDGLDPRS